MVSDESGSNGRRSPDKTASAVVNGTADAADGHLSPEDAEMKERLDLLVERVLTDGATGETALQAIADAIRSATSSMTSVPKPLKFLRPHYAVLQRRAEELGGRSFLWDVLSVMAMTMAETGSLECLRFKLRGTETCAVSHWGHEYVRTLAGEIGEAVNSGAMQLAEVSGLIDDILPVLMRNNAEPEACDLCVEVDQLERLLQPGLIERAKHERVCLYLVSCAQYLPEPEDRHALRVAYHVYLRAGAYARALRVALMMGDAEAQAEVMAAAPAGSAAKRQLEWMLHPPDLSEHLKRVARELEIHDAKTPEDIYKSHLVESMRRFGSAGGAAQMDSARQNLAATLVNALVNCGFSTDKLIVEPVAADAPNWIFRNKSHGLLSATASLGLIFLYDRDGGVAEINKHLDSPEEFVRAGAMLAIGMLGGGRVEDEFDTALALLSEPAEQSTGYTRLCAILGLGLAYAGTRNAQVSETLIPIVADAATTTETAAVAALALGLVFVSSADPDLTATLIQAMADHLGPGEAPNEGDAAEPMQTVDGVESAGAGDRGDGDAKEPPVEEATSNATAAATESSTTETATAASSSTPRPPVPPPPRPVHPLSHLFPLALGLLYLRCGGAAIDAVIEAAQAMGGGSVSTEVLEVCAHYGSGDVLTVQKFLAGGTEWTPLAVALVSGGEEIGQRMALRLFEHLQQYGNEEQKRTVPLALGALCVSDPRLEVIDALSKLSHDHDTEVAAAAVLGMGLAAAGTNNSRVAGLLRQLSAFYADDASLLFMVRLAQGLTHLGRGLYTLSPYYSEGALLNPVAAAGLLTVLAVGVGPNALKQTLLGRYHYLLYALALAVRPRFLITLDADTEEPVPLPVRVGQAVDTVGQAGRPKTITGFQTHTTPVLLSAGERAELATDDWTGDAAVLEGMVLVRKRH